MGPRGDKAGRMYDQKHVQSPMHITKNDKPLDKVYEEARQKKLGNKPPNQVILTKEEYQTLLNTIKKLEDTELLLKTIINNQNEMLDDLRKKLDERTTSND